MTETVFSCEVLEENALLKAQNKIYGAAWLAANGE